jgi:ribonucleoside-diphosphate reductase alpha chain
MSEVITSGSVDQKNSFQGIPTKKSIRKGATLISCSINHPDIKEFIQAKSKSNRLNKMNLSVLVCDKFIQKLKNDEDWELWFPDINFEKYDFEWDGDFNKWEEKGYPKVIYEKIKAKELWDFLMFNSFQSNDPGIIFIDNARKMNNLHYLDGGDIYGGNACHIQGSLIATNNGLVPVENIKIDDEIQTTLGFAKVKEIKKFENIDVYKVNFTDGFCQYVTEDHIFHTKALTRQKFS